MNDLTKEICQLFSNGYFVETKVIDIVWSRLLRHLNELIKVYKTIFLQGDEYYHHTIFFHQVVRFQNYIQMLFRNVNVIMNILNKRYFMVNEVMQSNATTDNQ